MLTRREELDAFLERGSDADSIALDTEFVRERTYYPKLCLVQIATAAEAVCIDCFNGVEAADLMPLMTLPKPLLLHSGRQDLEVLWQATGRMPPRLVDTQLAAGVVGMPAQIGYGDLANRLLGVALDKSHARRDWTERPLPEVALRYALDDVLYLVPVWHELASRLERLNRMDWLEEDCRRILETVQFEDLEQVSRRLKGIRRLKPARQAVAANLAEWREERAKRLDRPRRWVLGDETLVRLAALNGARMSDLNRVDGLPEKLRQRHGERLLSIINRPTQGGFRMPEPPTKEERAQQKSLAARIEAVAAELGLQPELVATRQDIAGLVRGEPPERLSSGWRHAILAESGLVDASGRLN